MDGSTGCFVSGGVFISSNDFSLLIEGTCFLGLISWEGAGTFSLSTSFSNSAETWDNVNKVESRSSLYALRLDDQSKYWVVP